MWVPVTPHLIPVGEGSPEPENGRKAEIEELLLHTCPVSGAYFHGAPVHINPFRIRAPLEHPHLSNILSLCLMNVHNHTIIISYSHSQMSFYFILF